MAFILSPVAVPQCRCPRCNGKNITLRFEAIPALLKDDLVLDHINNGLENINSDEYRSHFDTWLCLDCKCFDFPSAFID